MDVRKDLAFPLAIAIVGGTVAFFWPWLQTRQRGRRFEAIIWRELEEVGPLALDEKTSKPWWELLSKRFIHEEIFRRDRISENRDFILSIDPTLVYLVNQLWIAFENGRVSNG